MNIFNVVKMISKFIPRIGLVGLVDFNDIIRNLFDSMFPLEELYIFQN